VTASTRTEYTVYLPEPHELQAEIETHPAKRKVVCAGRRAGKTTLAALVGVERMLDGRRVLLASTTQDQADAFWDKAKTWLADLIADGLVYKNEARRILQFGAGRIRVKTGRDADVLRGDYADYLVLDECALLDPDAWDKVGAPMLLDNDGDAMFISTPRRRNWFYKLFLRGEQDGEYWHSWHFTSLANPYLDQRALEDLMANMSEEAYRQEILAEFLEGEGQVFRNIRACTNAPPGAKPEDHQGHRIVFGVDWAKAQDWTVISVFCVDCGCELQLERFNQIDYVVQSMRLKDLAKWWKPAVILAESNAMGQPLIDALSYEGLPVQGFETTATTKPQLIESLRLALERVEAQWLDIPVATSELEAYEQKVSPTTGRSTYSAPEGMHDDTVIARALALRAALTPASHELVSVV